MKRFTTEKNASGEYIHFASLNDFCEQTSQEGMPVLIDALKDATSLRAKSNENAWAGSLGDLALLMTDPDRYLEETGRMLEILSADMKAHAEILREDIRRLMEDIGNFDSYVGVSGKMMNPLEMEEQKKLCGDVRMSMSDLESRLLGTGDGSDSAIEKMSERIRRSSERFAPEVEKWRKRRQESPFSVPEDTEVILEYPFKGRRSARRIDVILRRGTRYAVIEQKSWTESYESQVRPDDQADAYVEQLRSEYKDAEVRGFAYLHNQLLYNGRLYQDRGFDKNRSYLYTRIFCGSMYYTLAGFLEGSAEE